LGKSKLTSEKCKEIFSEAGFEVLTAVVLKGSIFCDITNYIALEDDTLQNHRCENLKSYIALHPRRQNSSF
jgi:hypothetical protein